MEKVAGLAGLRILVVEDDALVALSFLQVLETVGATAVGPIGEFDAAVAAAAREDLGAAILDVNLHGRWAFPVADVLVGRGVPFLFASAYDSSDFPAPYNNAAAVQKPCRPQQLARRLEEVVGAAKGHPAGN